MKYKGFYDENFIHLGFLTEDDERVLSDNYVEVTEEELIQLNEETNGSFKYDSDSPEDLTKIKKVVEEHAEPLHIQEGILEGIRIQQEQNIEKYKLTALSSELDTLTGSILEIIPLLTLTGGEEMLIAMVANQIVFGRMQFKDVPAPIKAKVKEYLEIQGLGFLAVE